MSSSWIFLSVLALVCIATGLNVAPEKENDIMIPMVGMVTKEDITPYPADSYYSLRTDDIEVGFPKDLAEFEVAEHNVSRANEVFKVDFLTIAEVRTNGSYVTKPLSLDDGRWRNLKDQGGITVREYTTHVFARRRVVEVSIIVAISRNESTFSSTYGDTKLSKNQIKFSINVEDWPFESSDNFLNITMAAASTKHNSSQFNTEKDSVNWAEFGDIDNSDAHVLHIAFESSVIVDNKKTDNVTVYLDKDDNTITISLPHHDSFVFYDPVISLQEPESSSSNHTVLIVVLCIIGAIVLLVILAVIGFFIYRKRRSNYEVIE